MHEVLEPVYAIEVKEHFENQSHIRENSRNHTTQNIGSVPAIINGFLLNPGEVLIIDTDGIIDQRIGISFRPPSLYPDAASRPKHLSEGQHIRTMSTYKSGYKRIKYEINNG